MKGYFLLFAAFTLVLSHNLADIDKSSFGKSLLDTVDLQLRSEQSVDDLLSVLDQMRDTMNEQKELQEHEHQEFQQECAKDIDYYQQEIAQAIVLIVDNQRLLDQAAEDLKIVESLLQQVYEQMKVYQAALTKLNQIRLEEAKAFKQSMDEHDITTTAIEESKRYFVQIRGDISFLQSRQSILAQVSSHFNNARGLVKSQGNKALFKILGQITSKAQFDNAEIVAKILELCDRVLENVNESRMAEQEAENEKIKMFTDKKTVLDDSIFKTQGKINTLEDQKKSIEQQMHIFEEVVNDQTNRRDENQKLLDARKQECQEEIADYGESRGKALEQVGVVEKIITITETQLATMKQYLGERRESSGVKVNMKV